MTAQTGGLDGIFLNNKWHWANQKNIEYTGNLKFLLGGDTIIFPTAAIAGLVGHSTVCL